MLFFADPFLFLRNLTRLLQPIGNICYRFYWWSLLLLFWFSSTQENLYIIHHGLDLFYEIYNTVTEHNQRQTHSLSFIPIFLYISIIKWIKKSFYNFIGFIINLDFDVITFWMHYTLFIMICGRNKVLYYR